MKPTTVFSLNEIYEKGLLLKPNGKPFKDMAALRRRIAKFGHKPNRVDGRGMKIYGISEDELLYMNSHYE